MIDNLVKLGLALERAKEQCWLVTITPDGSTEIDVSAFRGDLNCPHQKPYSQSDGHGYESFETDSLGSLTALVIWIENLPELKR